MVKGNPIFFYVTLVILVSACKKNDSTSAQPPITSYAVQGIKIIENNKSVQLLGADGFHSFGAGGSDMNSWNVDIVREFTGNMRDQPLAGMVLRDSTGAYLHPLQTVADSNRHNNRITIFCPFGWDGTNNTAFTGISPRQALWWNDYKTKLYQWAVQFKGQPDVWLEVWNEPYRWDRADGYTDDIWWNDMNDMVAIIRGAGNNNIILVPCAEQGQDESVLLNKGNAFLTGKTNIIYDIHAYEKWLLVTNASMSSRLQQLQEKKLPIFFGEAAPLNASVLMDPKPFLDSIYNRGFSVCVWAWKYNDDDTDALLDGNGQPNNKNNNNWGSFYKNYCSQVRKP